MDNATITATTKFVYNAPCGYKNSIYDNQTEEVMLFILFLTYAIPTQILSLWLFKLIFFSARSKAFSSPFYSFFGISTIPMKLFNTDMIDVGTINEILEKTTLFFLGDQLFIRASVFLPGACQFWDSIVPEPSRLLSIPFLLQYYPVYSHLIFSIFITVNRMTAIAMPAHHAKYWKNSRPACIVFMLVFPLLITWQIYFAKSFFLPLRRGTAITYMKLKCPFAAFFRMSFITSGMYVISAVIIIVTTIVTVYLLYKLPQRRKDAEIQLCIVGIILAIGTGIDAAMQIYFVFYWAHSYQYIVRCIATDIPFVCAPWSLLFMSSEIKKEFRKAFGIKIAACASNLTSPPTHASFVNQSLNVGGFCDTVDCEITLGDKCLPIKPHISKKNGYCCKHVCHCDEQKCDQMSKDCSTDTSRVIVRTDRTHSCCDEVKCQKKNPHCDQVICPITPTTTQCPADSYQPKEFYPIMGCCPVKPNCRCRECPRRPDCTTGKVVRISNGTKIPGSCCNQWTCETRKNQYCKIYDYVFISNGSEWPVRNGTTFKCIEGKAIATCTKCAKLPNAIITECSTKDGKKKKLFEEWKVDDCTSCLCAENETKICEAITCKKTCPVKKPLMGKCCSECDEPLTTTTVVQNTASMIATRTIEATTEINTNVVTGAPLITKQAKATKRTNKPEKIQNEISMEGKNNVDVEPSTVTNASDKGGNSVLIIVIIVICVAVLLLVAGIVFWLRRRNRKKKAEKRNKAVQDVQANQNPEPRFVKRKKTVSIKKMKPAPIKPDEFKYKGPLKMSSGTKGSMRHALEGQKSRSIKDPVEFDNDLNEVVHIGTDVEVAEPTGTISYSSKPETSITKSEITKKSTIDK